jgi:hypothetical protein
MFNLNLGIHSFLIVVLIVSILATIGITTIDFDLMFEEEDNKITMTGTVEEISSVSSPPKFTYQGMSVIPKYITIDGQKYYIMYIGDIIEGDDVVIEVLPESKLVLSIYKEE